MRQKTPLFKLLLCLTILLVIAQIALFYTHFKVTGLLDALASRTLYTVYFYPVILLPLLFFILVQVAAYLVLTLWIWFVAISAAELCKRSADFAYYLGLLIWFLTCSAIFILNSYYYPHSFFAELMRNYLWSESINNNLVIIAFIFLGLSSLIVCINCFSVRHKKITIFFAILFSSLVISYFYYLPSTKPTKTFSQPNIILIGLDSLRPDYLNAAPHIKQFLQTSASFTEAYTPLARTFPAWVSLLTAKYPIHNSARANLADANLILQNEMLSKILKAQGYETIYATDESRFTDITTNYGYDKIIGPKNGGAEFLMAELGDFPLNNLLLKLPIARLLLPYQFGNRVAEISYDPKQFLQLVKTALAHPTHPIFLSVHLCLAHWPFVWAQDHQNPTLSDAEKYQHSVQALDMQFADLLKFLQKKALLEYSIIIIFSDHGVTLGLPNDRVITEKNYLGNTKQLKWLAFSKKNNVSSESINFDDYSINTSYGQGTDVLSLKQNHIVLGFKGEGIPAQTIPARANLLDITPTLLDLLHLAALKNVDGISLCSYFTSHQHFPARTFFMETADTVGNMATEQINVTQVIKASMNAYQVNPKTGLLSFSPLAMQSLIRSKQYSVLWDHWLLAKYPAQTRVKLAPDAQGHYDFKTYQIPDFYVLVDLKTGHWTFDLGSVWARKTPARILKEKLNYMSH